MRSAGAAWSTMDYLQVIRLTDIVVESQHDATTIRTIICQLSLKVVLLAGIAFQNRQVAATFSDGVAVSNLRQAYLTAITVPDETESELANAIAEVGYVAL